MTALHRITSTVRGLMPVLRWVWVFIILLLAGHFISLNNASITGGLATLNPVTIFGSVLLLLAGRVLIIVLARKSLACFDGEMGWRRLFRVYALSELAKYLPGSIWHFVGRAGAYHLTGLSIKGTASALLIEQIWLVSSAFAIGLIGLAGLQPPPVMVISVPAILLAWAIGLHLLRRWSTGKKRPVSENVRHISRLMALQTAIWVCLSTSFWVILPDGASLSWYEVFSAFCLAWVAGFVVVFAPGGLGIREIVLVALLTTYPASDALFYAGLHRLLWTLVEFVLGLLAAFIRDENVT